MRVFIAGINHNDVLGQRRLIKWLNEKANTERDDPEFVAVEWDEGMHSRVKAQRKLIGELVRKEWPAATDYFVHTIERSLGYDGDTHCEVFPSVNTIWLDKGRALGDPAIVDNYYVDRMNIYRCCAQGVPMDFTENLLHDMSVRAWDLGGSPVPGGDSRDALFSEMIIEETKRALSGWCIVIVGCNHAGLSNGSMAWRLRKEGMVCLPDELRPRRGN